MIVKIYRLIPEFSGALPCGSQVRMGLGNRWFSKNTILRSSRHIPHGLAVGFLIVSHHLFVL